jgi:hypothetical protein
MSIASLPKWPRVGQAARRLAKSFGAAPLCAICGRGHAMSGWHLDPMGGMHVRCPGCIDDVSPQRNDPEIKLPAAN